ncbi:GTP-binding protein REM 2 isoform X1 [Erpetoichthys calabaricus]|uniref:GTP-binding protein REM 2 isoform X1 n=2 Tax=Erpetoichthys calabaricus TaxID=27687 RepID=UPI00109FA2CD|nr:GTP-binding protein REM 2 isoform X1 [Erpetoichthys calabaricus]
MDSSHSPEMTLSSAPPIRRGSTPLPLKHQLKRESAVVNEEFDWTPELTGPTPPPIQFSSASEESIVAGKSEIPSADWANNGLIRVLLLGESGVGKTALTCAITGNNGRATSVDSENVTEDSYEKTILMDDEDITITFIDDWKKDLSLLTFDICLLIFSLTDRQSFHYAVELRLRVREAHPQCPIILVGNKSDLVRSREVTYEDASANATLFQCQYFETSAALDHNTFQLLEEVVKRLRSTERMGLISSPHRRRGRRRESITRKARRFLQSLVPRNTATGGRFFRQKSRSCHDLTAI